MKYISIYNVSRFITYQKLLYFLVKSKATWNVYYKSFFYFSQNQVNELGLCYITLKTIKKLSWKHLLNHMIKDYYVKSNESFL